MTCLAESHLPWGFGLGRSFPSVEGLGSPSHSPHLPDGGSLALDAWSTLGTSPLCLLLLGCSS